MRRAIARMSSRTRDRRRLAGRRYSGSLLTKQQRREFPHAASVADLYTGQRIASPFSDPLASTWELIIGRCHASSEPIADPANNGCLRESATVDGRHEGNRKHFFVWTVEEERHVFAASHIEIRSERDWHGARVAPHGYGISTHAVERGPHSDGRDPYFSGADRLRLHDLPVLQQAARSELAAGGQHDGAHLRLIVRRARHPARDRCPLPRAVLNCA